MLHYPTSVPSCMRMEAVYIDITNFDTRLASKRVQRKLHYRIFHIRCTQVTELSIEAFIIRLYRRVNRDGFVKAFTENAPVFQGFGKTQNIAMFISR